MEPNYQWRQIQGKDGSLTLTITGYVGTDTEANIPSAIDGVPVTAISSYVFQNKSTLTSVTIPESVTSIGAYAFSNCSALSQITVPGDMKFTDKTIFSSCTKLKTIHFSSDVKIQMSTDYPALISTVENLVFDEGVTSIADSAFKGCTKVKSVQLGEKCAAIGSSAFEGCTALVDVQFSDGLQTIGDAAFKNCGKIQNLDLPDTLISIGASAFAGNTGVTALAIPGSVKTISANAFANCTQLVSAVIPESVETIGKEVFSGCGALTQITVPGSMKITDQTVFSGCGNLKTVNFSSDVSIRMSTDLPGLYNTVENVALAEGVASIGDSAFAGCAALSNVDLSSTLQTIGGSAFKNCGSIESLTIPDSVTDIGASAFAGDTGLKAIKLPGQLKTIPDSAFENCGALESIKIPETVETIGKRAFYGCASVESVEIPQSVTQIKSYAFGFCSGLKTVKVPGGLSNIASTAFTDCTALEAIRFVGDVTVDMESVYPDVFETMTEVVFGDGVKTIAEGAFAGCRKLNRVVFSNDLESIGARAFSGCSGLEEVSFPGTLKEIGAQAFESCTGLSSLELGQSIETVGAGAFNNCKGIKTLTISGQPIQIGESAFANCGGIKTLSVLGDMQIEMKTVFPDLYAQIEKVTIGDNAKTVHANAFAGCAAVSEVSMPSVETIEENAFAQCANLAKIAVSGEMDDVDRTAFTGCTGLKAVAVSDDLIIQFSRIYPEIYRQITEITLKDDVLHIKDSAFVGCESLQNIHVGSGNPSFIMENGILYDHAKETLRCSLKNTGSYTIPETVTKISNYAFALCPDLKEVYIHDGVVSIEDKAFYNTEAAVYCNCNTYAAGWAREQGVPCVPTHQWQAPVYTWAEDHLTVTAERICANDHSHIETETAEAASEITLQPACTVMGQTTYAAAFENTAFEDQEVTLTNIPAIGHQWAEPTYTWADDLTSVTANRVCLNDSEHAETETVKVESEITTPATCYEMGETTYTAAFSNEAFAAQIRTVTDVLPLGHSWGEPTYTWAEDNSQVTAKRVCNHDRQHIESETADVTANVSSSPTCTGMGRTTYTASFKNAAFKTQTKSAQNIPATGHSVVTDAAVAPTCTEPGLTEGSHCSVCGTVIVQQKTVPATGHSLVKAANKVPATCTEAGVDEYWQCTVCEKLFSDQKAQNEIGAPIVIPAHGHNWGAPTYTWASDFSSITARRVCLADSTHQETETSIAYSAMKAPTAEGSREMQYVVRFSNPAFRPQKKSVLIPALQNMTVLELPAGLKTIGEEAFEGIGSQAVILPKGCAAIEKNAFRNCPNLRYVWIPSSVEDIHPDAFAGCKDVVLDYESGNGTEKIPLLNISMGTGNYDYAETVTLTASVAYPDGTTTGLEEKYQNAKISAVLITSDGAEVNGFAAQSVNGLSGKFSFQMKNKEMKAGYYRIRVITNVDNWELESEEFYYTAKKPQPSECAIMLTLNDTEFGYNDELRMTASVTDKHGLPAENISVSFLVEDPDGKTVWESSEITGEDGTCVYITTIEPETGLRSGTYRAAASITDGTATARRTFTLVKANMTNNEIAVDIINFPDPVFRNYISKEVDVSGNGALSKAEISAVTEMELIELGIDTIQGIEFFTNLKYLNCWSNNISSVDLSQNTALTELCLDACEVTSLDLSHNTALTSLYLASNNLTYLNVSKCPALQTLGCQYNNLTSLNLKSNTKLNQLYCQGNNFTTLDVSKCSTLVNLVKNATRYYNAEAEWDEWGEMGSSSGYLLVSHNVTVTAGTKTSKPSSAVPVQIPEENTTVVDINGYATMTLTGNFEPYGNGEGAYLDEDTGLMVMTQSMAISSYTELKRVAASRYQISEITLNGIPMIGYAQIEEDYSITGVLFMTGSGSAANIMFFIENNDAGNQSAEIMNSIRVK